MTMTEFLQKYGITATSERVNRNPQMDDAKWSSEASHWAVTFWREGAEMQTPYSMGSTHKGEPEAEDVLDCLASDSTSVENAESFEEWASEGEYDTDSRKAEATWLACCKQAEKLKAFLGSEAYELLLWEVERP